jgi:hypothetical protein
MILCTPKPGAVICFCIIMVVLSQVLLVMTKVVYCFAGETL